MSKKTRKFKAEVSQVLSLVINSLYSNKEIFVRELVSNASDALDKLQFEALTNPDLLAGVTALKIRIVPDEEAGTLTIWDNGIGMSEEELIEHLGTVAHSGSKAFLEALEEHAKSGDLNIIGQFGVGFYSAYLVAHRVDVISKRAGSDEAFKWSSDAQEKFTVEPAERDARGTSVVLHLRDDQKEFLDPFRLRQLVKEYSDFVGHPIEMLEMKYGDDDGEPEFEQVNQANALWMRRPEDIDDEQYDELYRHISGDWEPPMAHTHFKIEGMQQFTGLLYIPSRPPFDLFNPDARHGVRLFVKRVFIMDDAEALVPRWLRFVRGVVDSDDLPLNVSRELLQDSKVVRVMRKQVVKKVLDLLGEVADERPEDYEKLWSAYGTVLKEGLHFDPQHADKLAELVRFGSSKSEKPTSLADYVSRMQDGQETIYYALGASRALLESSPHLEALKKRDFEVLYLTDSIDQWAIEALDEYDGKKLVDAVQGELDLGDDESDDDETRESLEPLTEQFEEILSEDVSEVRLSRRLADSPACLVVPEGGVASHIERLLRAQNQDMPQQKRILELNPTHPLIESIRRIHESGESERVREWVELVYDQALLAEGSPIKEPGTFARRLTALMAQVAELQATA
jgi:molecular chaperone HtpG